MTPNTVQLPTSVTDKPDTSLYDPETKLIAYKHDLLKQGLANGREAAYGAFIAFGVVYASTFVLYCVTGSMFITLPYLLGFSIVLAASVLIYFSIIFGYSVYFSADLDKKRVEIKTEKNPNTSR